MGEQRDSGRVLTRRGKTTTLTTPDLPRYEILEELAAGGMGIVYKARDTRLGRLVVLKFLPPHLGFHETAKKRFLTEAQAAAGLEHPNICTIHEIGQSDNGELYIVMTYYEGETLARKIERGPLPITQALAIAIDLARGLAKAHDRGIVHRDIKPANVMITSEGVVKILDFGIAKLSDRNLTQTGGRIGTLAYMSPEQAFGDEIDHRTDIWSLGAVLYEMLTGVSPVRGETEQAMLYDILTQEPEPLSSIREDVPAALDALVRRALAKQPADRPVSMNELAAELTAINATLVTEKTPRKVSKLTQQPHDRRASGLASAGERRQATVLVSQLVGYQSLVERRSQEEVDRITGEIRDAATELTTLHGGVVNQFTGEELVVLFGVPSTHEDDFVRAGRAALALHERVRALSTALEKRSGVALRLRSGMHTGVVVTQQLRGGDRRYRVAGSPLSIATRLASLADRDAILVNSESRRLIEPFFNMQESGLVALQADAPAVTTFRIVGESGLQTRMDAAERIGLTPYAGHARELETLAERFDAARRGNGQLVIVTGEVGVGKSRLLYEFRQRLVDAGVRVLRGSSGSYGVTAPYRPFIEALREALSEGCDCEQQCAPHDDLVARVRAIDPSLEDYIPLYLHLLSIPSDAFPMPRHLKGDQLPAAMMEALAAIFTMLAKQSPALLLLEDWHWVDEASRAVLRQIAEIVSAYPLLIVVLTRPEPQVEWGSADHQTLLHIGPLDATASLAIMKSVLGAERVSEDLVQKVMQRTGGNPFFLEEICHTLVEARIVTTRTGEATVADRGGIVHLPHTVQAVIRSRIDRLDPDAHEVLRVASVVGLEFGRRILDAITDSRFDLTQPLERLKASGLIQQTCVVPEPAYRFKHALTQEVAYDSLLEHQRTELHRAAGRAIEQVYQERLDEQFETLARHFSRAEQWREGILYGVKAAERSATFSQFAEALSTLERGQEWLTNVPDADERRDLLTDILLRQERYCETLGLRDRQQRIVDDLISLLEPQGKSKTLAEAYRRKGDVCTLLRQFEAADQALGTALQMSRDCADATGERHAIRSLGLLRWHEGNSEAALELVTQALERDRERGDEEAVESDLSNLGHILKGMGEYERARECFEEALDLSVRLKDSVKQLYILHGLGNVHRALGNIDQALRYLRQADDEARKQKATTVRSFHLTSIAHLTLQQGRVEESLRLYREAVEVSRQARHADGLAQSLRMLGELLCGVGRDAEALPHLREGVALFAQLEDRETEILMWSRLAAVCERLGRYDEAIAAWESARSLGKDTGDMRAELDAVEGTARAARQKGDVPEAIKWYEEALKLVTAAGDLNREAALCNTLGIIQWERGNYDAALADYQRSLELFRELGDRVHEGLILNSIGVTLTRMQRYEEARATLEAAASLNSELGERLLEAHSLASLGAVYRALGGLGDSLDRYERSLAIRREIGDKRGEGWMLHHIASVHRARGDEVAARTRATEAARIATENKDAILMAVCADSGEVKMNNNL